MMADKATGQGKPARKESSEAQGLQHRRLYLTGRVASLKQELTALTAERADIDAKLKANPNPEETKKLRQRKVYVAMRPRDLKEELKTANNELMGVSEKLKSGRPAKR